MPNIQYNILLFSHSIAMLFFAFTTQLNLIKHNTMDSNNRCLMLNIKYSLCSSTDMGDRSVFSNRITFGQLAGLKEFPWQVAITLRDKYHCGGSIIGDRHVITAAHCVISWVWRPVPYWPGIHLTVTSRSWAMMHHCGILIHCMLLTRAEMNTVWMICFRINVHVFMILSVSFPVYILKVPFTLQGTRTIPKSLTYPSEIGTSM